MQPRPAKKQYGRAYKAETMADLCEVIKDNFDWCCDNKVLDGDILSQYQEAFAENDIYVNVNVDKGYLLATGSATVTATGSAYITSYSMLECKLSDKAIYRVQSTNTVYYAGDIRFVKQETK